MWICTVRRVELQQEVEWTVGRRKLPITVCVQAEALSARSVTKKGFRDQIEVGQTKEPLRFFKAPRVYDSSSVLDRPLLRQTNKRPMMHFLSVAGERQQVEIQLV